MGLLIYMSDNGSGGGKKAIFDGDLKMVQWRWAFTPERGKRAHSNRKPPRPTNSQ